jgi:hypothetical protein
MVLQVEPWSWFIVRCGNFYLGLSLVCELATYAIKLILGFPSKKFLACVVWYGTPVCKVENSNLSEDAARDLDLEAGGRHYEAWGMQ